MAKLSRNDVLKLAKLAQLSLTDNEVDEFVVELSNILTYVEQLQAIDTSDLKPTDQVTGLVNVMREDKIVGYSYKPEMIMSLVPSVEAGQIKVKRIIE